MSGFNPKAREFIPHAQGRFALPNLNSIVANIQQRLISLPLQQNHDFASGVNLHSQQQNDSGYHTPYQNNGNFNPMNTTMPREQQDVPNIVNGQQTSQAPQQQQFLPPYGGFTFPPPVIQVMSAKEFLIQHSMLWNEYAKVLLELATLRENGVERPVDSENIHPDISTSKNVVDSATQTDIVTHRPRKTQTDTVTFGPRETQTDVTFESVGVQYEDMSVATEQREEESPLVTTSEVSLPSDSNAETTTADIDGPVGNGRDSTPIEIVEIVSSTSVEDQFKGACDSTKIQMATNVLSGLTNVTTVKDTIDPVGNGSGPITLVTSESSPVQEIASSLPVSVQHKEMSGHSLEQDVPNVSATEGSLPSISLLTTVTDTQSTFESRRAPSILIDFKSPKVLTFVSSMGDQCQVQDGTTGERHQSVGVSPSKTYASVAAAVTGTVENARILTTSKCDFLASAKNVRSGRKFNAVSPTRNSAKTTMVPSTSGTFQWSKVRKNVSSTSTSDFSKTGCGVHRNGVQKKNKPVERDAKVTSNSFETVASSTAGPSLNYSFQIEAEPQVATTSPEIQTQEERHLEVSQENWTDEQGPPLDDVQIAKILETVTHPADMEALAASCSESSSGEHKDQSEGSKMENFENIGPIQSKQPTKPSKNSKTAKKRKGGKVTKQGNKNLHAQEMGTDDDEELNRAIKEAKGEIIIRNGFQRFIQPRVDRYFEAMGSTRYLHLAFIKERRKGHEFLEAIMEHWKQNLSQLHNLDYHRSDKEIESLLNTRITKYCASQDAEDWKLCFFFKLIFNKFKDPDTEVNALQDLLFLYNGKKSDFVQKNLDTKYYKMILELDSWLPDDLGDPSMSAADLPPNSLDELSTATLVIHINEQAKNRYLVNKDIPQIALAHELVLWNAFQKVQEEKLDWSPAKTKELFQERCEFWRKFENRNSDQSKFVKYYELLSSISSSVIDFDAYYLHQCIQNIPKKDVERIWIAEMQFMCAMFSFVAADDVIAKS